jgi:hypothetical protein
MAILLRFKFVPKCEKNDNDFRSRTPGMVCIKPETKSLKLAADAFPTEEIKRSRKTQQERFKANILLGPLFIIVVTDGKECLFQWTERQKSQDDKQLHERFDENGLGHTR